MGLDRREDPIRIFALVELTQGSSKRLPGLAAAMGLVDFRLKHGNHLTGLIDDHRVKEQRNHFAKFAGQVLVFSQYELNRGRTHRPARSFETLQGAENGQGNGVMERYGPDPPLPGLAMGGIPGCEMALGRLD